MTTTALVIQCAIEAGLLLVGQDADGEPEFLGDKKQWRRYGELVKWCEDTGTFPWVEEKIPF